MREKERDRKNRNRAIVKGRKTVKYKERETR